MNKWERSPTAEAIDSKPIKCEFESHRSYHLRKIKMKKIVIFAIVILATVLTACKDDNKFVYISNTETSSWNNLPPDDIVLDFDIIDEDDTHDDIGNPAYHPGFKYGLSDGIVIVNDQGTPIVDILINGVSVGDGDMFVKNKEWFSIEMKSIVDEEVFIEIFFQNGKYYFDYIMFLYEGPHVYFVRKL